MPTNPIRWFADKLVQPDPQPEPSILDILDSRGTVPLDEGDDVAAYYARVTEVQKRSAWS